MANSTLFVLLFLSVSPCVHVLCFTVTKSFHNGAKLGWKKWGSSTTTGGDDAITQHYLFRKNDVHVYDNVVPPNACEAIRYLALEHADRCGGSCSVFYWNGNNNHNNNNNHNLLTPLEQALQSILEQLMPRDATDNNEPWIVEYWSREEYMNMDTHSDIDEQLLLNEGVIHCPDHGHVLYLHVDSSIRGPTCVFSKEGGWHPQSSADKTTSLITVPAVPGRLLHFPGALMHAVPKPTSLWFLEEAQQAEILAAENDMDWDDDDDDDEDDEKRCVVLFNLWRGRGPGGKTEDVMEKGILPDGIGFADQDDNYIQQEKERRVMQWDEEYGVDCRDLWCNTRDLWNTTAIVDNCADEGQSLTAIHVPLMGNKARRVHPQRQVCLSSPSRLESALQEMTTPRHFILREEE
jgi:hypothetical protein